MKSGIELSQFVRIFLPIFDDCTYCTLRVMGLNTDVDTDL